jgi:hypothetical protein
MQFVLVLFAVCTSVHAWSYGRFIEQQGNRLGAMGIYLLVAATISLSLYEAIK